MPPDKLQRLLSETAGHLAAGRLAVAARLCAQARAAAPRDFAALFLSGATALAQENFSAAADWLAAAHRRDARSAPCALRLGFALAKLGRHDEAERALRAAVALAPHDAEAWDTLCFVLKNRGALAEAVAAHRRATGLQPARALSWHNLGHALQFSGRPAEALAAHERAVAAEPASAPAHFGHALALQACHRISEAVAAYDATLALAPAHHAARSQRLMARQYVDGVTREELFREHAAFGAAVGEARPRSFANAPDPARRLRVAFLSPDLRTHSVAYFLEPLLAHLDRAAFEVFLYHDHFVTDATSEKLRGFATCWRNFIGQPGAAVEAAIRADAPDVLVDLAGHTGLNRLELFARRLAPVQLSYLGYPGTTGLRAMDFRFVDAVTDPPDDAEKFHTEKLVRFAPTAWSYAPPADAPEPALPPGARGEPVTFGCFNNLAKVTDAALAAWRRLLDTVPGSRLRLKADGLGEAATAGHFRARLARAGLAFARVELCGCTPTTAAHLALYRDLDVALDTFPYHGTTTTCEALWMGVPVVTLRGDRHASRVGASLLTAVGHVEWITRDWDDYVRIAAALTTTARPGLRDAMRRSALLDHAGQAARFGAALRECWTAWCGRAAAAA